MRSKSAIYLFVLLVSLVLSSCVRNNLDLQEDPNINGVTIPSDFDWSTIKSVQLTVVPADAYNAQYYYVIEVYGENPLFNSTAPLLAKGVAKGNDSFVANLVLPTSTSVIYVRQTNPVNDRMLQCVDVSGATLVCDFHSAAVSAPQAMPAMPSLRSAKVVSVDPTPTVVTVLKSTSSDVRWTDNVNYLIPQGETYTGSIDLGQNSKLYVEGTYAIANKKSLDIATGGKLVIQSSGKLQVPSTVDLSFHIGQIKNYGSLVANGKFALTSQSTMYNAGTMSFANFTTSNATNEIVNDGVINAVDLSVQSNPFTNNGSLTVTDVFEVTSTSSFANTGSVVVAELDAKSGSKIYNNCHIQVNTLLDVHGLTYYGYKGSLMKTLSLVADGTSFLMSESSILEAQAAEFSTWRNYINGVGTDYALARFGSVNSYKKAVSKNITYQGKLEVECSNHLGNEKYNPFWVVEGTNVRWSAAGASTTVIASTGCNDGGNADNSAGNDVPPADPAFPITVNLTTNYSFIMEDNWPWLGDYDLNDLVVDLNISYLQNADNKASKMTVIYKLRAVGATKKIAAAFQLDKITSAQISSVTYKAPVLTGIVFKTEKGGLETGQSKAVVPLFDDAHLLLDPSSSETSILNTISGGRYFEPVSDTISIVFATPVDPSNISISNLNFFIVTSPIATAAKRSEVHLSGFEPTDKADLSLLGTGADNSLNGVKYRTKGNMIWGLLIPISFNYASEWRDITAVYPDFAEWCTSGGVEKKFWYESPTDKAGYVFSK